MGSRFLKQHLLVDDFDREAIRRKSTTFNRHSQSSFVKTFLQNLGGFIVALNHIRQYLVIILIIIIAIIEHLFI